MERTPFETRHVNVGGKRTSIAMESLYWSTIEVFAAGHGSDWKIATEAFLEQQPSLYKSRSSYLRFMIMNHAVRKITALQAELSNASSFHGGTAHSTSVVREVNQNNTEYRIPNAPGRAPRDPTLIDLPSQLPEARIALRDRFSHTESQAANQLI